jgi:betaine-homocysteine S-methyltransferase
MHDSVLGLHREFLHAGSDVMQAFTFYASDDKLDNRGNLAAEKYMGYAINKRAAELAKQVAAEGDALTLGGVSQCPTYLNGASKAEVQAKFLKQIQVFVEADLDFLLCEV